MFEKAILHLDLDSFFVSVECLKNSSLRGKPLIIGGLGARGVVASCSNEARRFGVHSAMPLKMALRICPHAVVLQGDVDSYSHYSSVITELIQADAPIFEKASLGTFYLDLTGMDKYLGCMQWSMELRMRVMKESGLPSSFALSVNKLVSKVGSGEAKPNGMLQVPAGTEKLFLAPMATRKIPGIRQEIYKKLSFMGVRTIRVLSEIPQQLLEREFGNYGRKLWEHANAIDNSPVVPYHEKQSISKERTFAQEILNIRKVKELLHQMIDELAYELRACQKLTSCLSIKIKYADFNTYTKQRKITHTASNKVLLIYVKELFDSLYQRRQLIRLIGVKLSDLVSGHYQINMFDDTIEEVQLIQQLDHIRQRFGKGAIGRADYLG